MRHSKSEVKKWFPLWIDSWLFGSMRHEFAPHHDLRAIFLDLLALSKKDNGFIRANEQTPYPPEQLAGMFCVPIDRLKLCIEKSIETGKLTEISPGIYFVTKHDDYELTERHKRRFSNELEEKSENTDTMSENEVAKGKESKGKKSTKKNISTRESTTKKDLQFFLSKLSLPINHTILSPEFTQTWERWIKYRHDEKRKPLTESMMDEQLKFLSKQPNPVSCIEQSIRNGWQGIFEDKQHAGTQQGAGRLQQKRPDFTPADLDRYR